MSFPTAMSSTVKPEVQPFYDRDTNTWSYIVKDPGSRSCAIVDSVANLDYPSCTLSHEGADAIIAAVERQGLQVEWIIETHAHADHLTAAPYLKERLGGRIAIGAKILVVQRLFGKLFNLGPDFARDGSQFDHLFEDGETYRIGGLEAHALATPGHTPADMTHLIGDAAFVGDTLFLPDGGTARADFPGGDARVLFRSIRKLLELPPDTRLFMCHDYPADREERYLCSVAEQRSGNIHVHDGISEDEFVQMRERRDAGLAMPRLILPSLQVNIRAGHLPAPEDNGRAYFKLPINAFKR